MSDEGNAACIVCERPLAGAIFMRLQHEGESVHLCCPLCAEKFDSRKKFYLARVRAQQAFEQTKAKRKKQS
jgi:hypothetical protein